MRNDQTLPSQSLDERCQRNTIPGKLAHSPGQFMEKGAVVQRMLRLLATCNRLLVHATDEHQFCQDVCHAISSSGQYPWVWVGFAHEDAAEGVRLVAQVGQAQAGQAQGHLELLSAGWPGIAWEQTPAAIALRTGQPCIVNRVLEDAADTPWRSEVLKYGYGAILALPLLLNDQERGVLNVYAYEADTFTTDHVALFTEMIADLTAGLIALRERIRQRQVAEQLPRLQADLERRTEAFMAQLTANNRVLETEIVKRTQAEQAFQQVMQQNETLYGISYALLAAQDLEELLRAFASPFLEYGPCNADMFWIASDDEGQPIWAELVARVQTALGPAVPLGMRYHMQDLPLGRRLLAAPYQIALMRDVDATHELLDERTVRIMKSIGARSMAGIPLLLPEMRWIGIVTLSWPHPQFLHAQELKIYQVLAPQLATQVENRRLRTLSQKSAEHDRLVAENATYMISRQTPDGVYLYVSPACEMLLGYEPSYLIDRRSYDFCHPEDYDIVDKSRSIILELPVSHTVSYRLRRKDGFYIWVETTSRAIRDPVVGTVHEILAVSRDVTDRKRVEEARAELSRRNDALVKAMGEVVYEHLVKKDTILWSGDYTRVLGYSPEEMGSDENSWLGRVHLGDLPSVLEEFDNAFAEGRLYDLEYRFRHRANHYVWLNARGVLHIDNEGKLDRIIGVMRDITLRKQAEEELKKRTLQLEVANKELEAFSYSVSHDLRAPLRSIDGFSQALLEDYTDRLDAEGKDYLQRVRAASKRMAQLIDDLLGLSRVTRSEMHREAVDLSSMVQTILMDLRKTQPERQVTVSIAGGVVAEGDTRLLQVALENLLANAWKFTSKTSHTRIEFGVTEHNDEPVYFIRDNGAGFDMAYVGKLFGAFQRLHISSEFAGTGIGLATVQRIIHRHGGRVWAEGAVGQGATFYFTLPA